MAKQRYDVHKRNKKSRQIEVNLASNIQQALQYQQTGYLNEAELIYKNILSVHPQQADCLHFLGMLNHQRDKNDEAITLIKKSIKLDKNNPIFYNNYGLVLEYQNKLDEAEKAYKHAIKYNPEYVEAWYNLALTYSRKFDYHLSEKAYKKAIKLKPDYIKALYNLACVQESQSKKEDANKTIQKILEIIPDTAEVHNTLGSVFYKQGGVDNYSKAEKHFLKAIELKQDYLDAYINLGKLFEEGNNLDDSIRCYEEVLKLEQDHPVAKLRLALALVKEKSTEQPILLLTQLLEKSPKNTQALTGLGNIKLIDGDFKEAEKLFTEVIKINNEAHDAYFGLSQCKKYKLNDDIDFINDLKSRAEKYKDSSLYYALGKVCNDTGQYDEAFYAYQQGNNIKNNKINYVNARNTEKIDSIINIFSNDNIEKLSKYGIKSEIPVFIIGTPRSGTTLTEQIISSHSMVYGAGELTYIKDQLKNISIKFGNNLGIPHGIEKLNKVDINYYSNEYLEKILKLCNGKDVKKITDKMPSNFLYIGYILSILPNAKVIHCKRNALDTCLSIYFQLFHSRHEYSFNLENLGHWYKDYLKIMNYWIDIFGNKIFTIDYEETINDSELTVRKILDYCDLNWEDQCLEFYKVNREVKTASQWQVRQPIYKTSLGRWKNYDKYIGVLKEILYGYY